MKTKITFLSFLMIFCLWTVAGQAETVRLHGAASTVDSLIAPNKIAVEKMTGHTLSIVRSNAGKGLVDLVDGKCDAALASASLDAIVKAAKAAGRNVDTAKLVLSVAAADEVVFIVNPKNPVSRLSWEQLRDIHTGKITNWKELGGKDAPIIVFTDAAASATRGLIKQVVMDGREYTPKANALDFVSKVNDMVAVHESGIGGLGKGFVNPKQVKIVESKKVERPLGFITVGAPAGAVKQVIEAFRDVAGKK
ncbi:MAG: substrate-binding domain-containing protein [Syntrophales bacterium]|nr:substrate-binding domain-containing protein [Syntrophales bacterium]